VLREEVYLDEGEEGGVVFPELGWEFCMVEGVRVSCY
jgi:hypothetical protein